MSASEPHTYVWVPDSGCRDGGQLVRCWQGRWTCTDLWEPGLRDWRPEQVDIRFEGHAITPESAERYCAGGLAPTSADFPGRRPMQVSEAKAAAEALAEWPDLAEVREILLA